MGETREARDEQPDASSGESQKADRPVGLPHDALFRLTFHDPGNAASELRAVVPERLAVRIAWDALELVPGSFVDDEFRQRHSDALYRTLLNARDAYVYVLFEHQSTPDPIMAVRMLDYTVRIWLRHHEQHPVSPPRLPLVIPVVLYHGQQRWTAATSLTELLDLDDLNDNSADADADGGHGLVPTYRYVLDDLARTNSQALRRRPLTPSALPALILLRLPAAAENADQHLAEWVAAFRAVLDGDSSRRLFRGYVLYLVSTTNTPADAIAEFFATIHPDLKGLVMTTAERLLAEGEARGRAEGKAQGQAEGEAKLFTSLLELRFGTLTPETRARVDAATPGRLRAWSSGFVDGTLTLDDLND